MTAIENANEAARLSLAPLLSMLSIRDEAPPFDMGPRCSPGEGTKSEILARAAVRAAAPHLIAGALRSLAADTKARGDVGKDGGIEAWKYLEWNADQLTGQAAGIVRGPRLIEQLDSTVTEVRP